MFNNTNGYSLADIAAATGNGNNNGGFGNWGDGWWIILLFLFAGGGWGGGFGGFGGGAAGGVGREVSYGFDMNNLENGIRGIQNGLCDGFYAMNTGLLNTTAQLHSTSRKLLPVGFCCTGSQHHRPIILIMHSTMWLLVICRIPILLALS